MRRAWSLSLVSLSACIAVFALACGDDSGATGPTPSAGDSDGGTGEASTTSSGGPGPGPAPCAAATSSTLFAGAGVVHLAVGSAGAFACREAPSTADAGQRVEIYGRAGDGAWKLEQTVAGASQCEIAASPTGQVAATLNDEASGDLAFLQRSATGAWTSRGLADLPDRSTPVTVVFGPGDAVHLATATSPFVGVDRLLYGERSADGGVDWSEVDRTTNSFGVLDNIHLLVGPSGAAHFLYRHSPKEGTEESLKYAGPADGGFESEVLPLLGRENGRRTAMTLGPNGDVHVSAYFESQFEEAIVHLSRDGDSWVSSDVQRHKHAGGELVGPTAIGVDSKGRLRVVYADADNGGITLATRETGGGGAWTVTPILALPKNDAGFDGELRAARLGPDDRLHVLVAEPEQASVVHTVTCPLP